MNTVLVYLAPDIFTRDSILALLAENNIPTYNPNDSINIIYPNMPNLYFGGASAIHEGFRILVAEADAEKAEELIKNWLEQFNKETHLNIIPLQNSEEQTNKNLRRFYYLSMTSLLLPGILIPIAIYFFIEAIKNKEKIKFHFVALSFLIMVFSLVNLYFFIKKLS